MPCVSSLCHVSVLYAMCLSSILVEDEEKRKPAQFCFCYLKFS